MITRTMFIWEHHRQLNLQSAHRSVTNVWLSSNQNRIREFEGLQYRDVSNNSSMYLCSSYWQSTRCTYQLFEQRTSGKRVAQLEHTEALRLTPRSTVEWNFIFEWPCIFEYRFPFTGQKTIGSESAVWPPDDGRKNARNMLRNYWLPINH